MVSSTGSRRWKHDCRIVQLDESATSIVNDILYVLISRVVCRRPREQLLLLLRLSAEPNACWASGERGGVRVEPKEPTGEGGTTGKAESRDSAMLDAALSTESREDRGAFIPSTSCLCWRSKGLGGTMSVSRLPDEENAMSFGERGEGNGSSV